MLCHWPGHPARHISEGEADGKAAICQSVVHFLQQQLAQEDQHDTLDLQLFWQDTLEAPQKCDQPLWQLRLIPGLPGLRPGHHLSLLANWSLGSFSHLSVSPLLHVLPVLLSAELD